MDQTYSRSRKNLSNQQVFVRMIAIAVVGALLALTIPASALAAGPVSQAQGRLLTASLLGSALDPLIALNGAAATNPGGPATSNVALDATALGAITAQANGINLFGNAGIIQLGAVGQYAAANADGSSFSFSGAVSQAPGLIGIGTVTPGNVGTPTGTDSATINVGTTQILTGPNLVQLGVDIGALAASAHETTTGAQSGSSTLASLDVAVGGTVIGTTTTAVTAALAPALTAISAIPGTPVIVNPLAGGQVTITLTDLLAAAGAANINSLAPGTDLLSSLPLAVKNKLTTSVNALLATMQSTITAALPLNPVTGLVAQTALNSASLLVATILSGLTAALVTPLLAAVSGLLQLKVNTQSSSLGSFTQNALTIGIGPAGAIARVGLANATVGPNAGPVVSPPAALTGMSPNSGPVTGNTTVTVTGSGFTGTTGVTFDGLPATSFAVVSDTTITAVSPPHAVGPVNVVIVNPNGNSPGTAASVFTYTPLVITPNSGPTTGATVVSIVGSCFTGATGVTFAGIPGTGFSVVDDTHILVTSPAQAAAAVNVVVQGSVACGGTTTVVNGFTFIAPNGPVAQSLTPPSGPASGGTTVTVTGTNFAGATGVSFDGIPATGVTVVNSTTITGVSPPHAVGGVNVVVQTPLGPSAPLAFGYLPTTVTTVDPGTGPETGGTAVTITGGCFTGATGVFFGTTAATSFVVVNDTTIRAFSPPGPGSGVVSVVGNPGCGTGILANAFRYSATGLAFTGALVIPSLLTALLLLLGGLGIVLARRRRNRLNV